jgi:hypothetical protein
MISPSIAADLEAVRSKLKTLERASHTTDRFQDQILSFIEQNQAQGHSIIEVGCYHGGLTAQLALVARTYGLDLHVVDIDAHYLGVAADTVAQCGLEGAAKFHLMDLATLVASTRLGLHVLVFVDGDHRYDGVVADIKAIRSMNPAPFACAFHDFSLRYADGPLTDVRVDRAVLDEFGRSVELLPIGEIAGESLILRTEPGEDRHYHESGMPEGVVIRL